MRGIKSVANLAAIGSIVLAAFIGSVALAQPAGDATAAPSDFGSQTNAWLSMQLNPAYTANDPRPIPGEVANRTYVRYLDSFSHPIPEQFERQSFSGSGGGAGGGASAAGGSAP